MVRRMLKLRNDIFDDYGRDEFLTAVRDCGDIVETCEIIPKNRVIVWYRRHAA
jgi:hypothetical protein